LERLRKDLNAKKVTYEEQLALEKRGKADALFELCRRFTETLEAKTTDPITYGIFRTFEEGEGVW